MPLPNFPPWCRADVPVAPDSGFFNKGQTYPPDITVLLLLAETQRQVALATRERNTYDDAMSWYRWFVGRADRLMRARRDRNSRNITPE